MANNFADFVAVMALPWGGATMLCLVPIAILEWLEERRERSPAATAAVKPPGRPARPKRRLQKPGNRPEAPANLSGMSRTAAWTAGGAQGEGGGHEAGQRKSAPPVDETGRGAKDNKPFLGYQKMGGKASVL